MSGSYVPTGGFVVGKTLGMGFVGQVSRERDAVIHARAVRPTDTAPIPFGAAVRLNLDNTISLWTATATTLTTALTDGTAYTSLTVAALSEGAAAGSTVTLTDGDASQTAILSADAAEGDVTLDVISFTANAAYAADSGIVVANTAAQMNGIAIREVRQATDYMPVAGTPGAKYWPGQPCDVLQRGSITVLCQRGTPESGAPVYIRVALNDDYPDAVIGGFEAEADGANTLAIGQMQWTTATIDSNDVTELTILDRVSA